MGIYSHLTTPKLEEMRDSLMQALMSRHTSPARVASNGRDVTYRAGGDILPALPKALDAIALELARRTGAATRGPIYLMT